jgi:rhodanese-related sulfurtransferase
VNFKYYLRGLGTGIVVTLIIVTISNSLRGSKTASENAAQPSSVQPTSAIEAILNNQRTTQAYGDAASADATSADAASADVTSADVISADTSSAETVSDNVQQGQQGRNITVSFETIQSSEAAAQLLEKAGIVDNWRNFNSYLVNNGYDRKVSGGTFSFSGNESYKEIAGIITKSR